MNRQNVDVESVEINFPSDKFNNGFTLQDTPGVDSNVATHQSSTEQFIYTSNILFYTVDYNHVQSALNFKFMKRINEVGIPVVFVINQIDKHNEEEITFDTFKARVENQSMIGIFILLIHTTSLNLIIRRIKLMNYPTISLKWIITVNL